MVQKKDTPEAEQEREQEQGEKKPRSVKKQAAAG